MPRFKLKARDKKVLDKIQKAYEQTTILQRQERMTYGRWDFAVFGPDSKEEFILRVGFAEHASIKRAPIYIASLADPEMVDLNGVPIEEFIEDDVPDEYRGLEVVQIDPVRPLTVQEKKKIPKGSQAIDTLRKTYGEQNIALIQAPRESDWMISVIRYLNECDQAFPDRIQETFRSGGRLGSGKIFSSGPPGGGLLN